MRKYIYINFILVFKINDYFLIVNADANHAGGGTYQKRQAVRVYVTTRGKRLGIEIYVYAFQ